MSSKSKFWSSRNGEHFSESKPPVAELYIISTIRPGSAVGAGRSLYREPSTLEAILTLPLVNPPISRGLLSNLFSPSRGSARVEERRRVMQRPLLPAENGRDGSRAENGRDPRISLENVELEALDRPLDASGNEDASAQKSV